MPYPDPLMHEPPDTEITLGAGKILLLFFGLVVLCSVFFALGFKLGKGSASTPFIGDQPTANVVTGGARPSATKSSGTPSSEAPPTKAAAQEAVAAPASPKLADTTAPAETTPPDPASSPPSAGYFVQVAAVSKEDDGEALVDSLKKKQYPAFATSSADKLYHVQVGPFRDIKDAELTRAKLVADGYNPILKK